MAVGEGEWARTEDALYADWKRDGRHLAEYASEFAGTLFNVFCVVGVVAWMFAPSSPVPRAVPPGVQRIRAV